MMKLGSQGIAAIYLGGQEIKKAYLGEAVVFDTAGPPEPVTYTITLSVDPQGGGTVTGGGSVEEGMSVTVSSTPANGYTFSGWRENGTIVSTSPSYTFAVTSDRSLTAVFAAEVQNYNIVTSVDPAGAGTASGGGTYTQGQSVTLTASPGDGYKFVKWTEGGQTVSESASYTFTVSGDRALVAVFEAEQTSRLPAGYTEVEYVCTSINTLAYSKPSTYLSNGVLDMDITVTETLTGTCDIFHCSQSSSSKYYFVSIEARKNGFWLMSYPGAVSTTASPVQLTTSIPPGDYHIHVDVPNKTASVNNVAKDIPNIATANANSTIGPFLDYAGSSKIRFRECIIKNATSTDSVRNMHLVPCKKSTGTVGFYDLYDGNFYGSGNTNYPWTAGPAV